MDCHPDDLVGRLTKANYSRMFVCSSCGLEVEISLKVTKKNTSFDERDGFGEEV
jgi:hypothetical protein